MNRRLVQDGFGRLRSALQAFALAAFACRAIVPIGYMPAPLDAGGPFLPCHGTSAGVLLRMLGSPDAEADAAQVLAKDSVAAVESTTSGHAHPGQHMGRSGSDRYTDDATPASIADLAGPEGQQDHESGIHASWEHCPLGVALSDAALRYEITAVVPATTDRWGRPHSAVPTRTSARFRYEARAPPA